MGVDDDVNVSGNLTVNDIDILNPSQIYNLNHDSFSGFVVGEHVNWNDGGGASTRFETSAEGGFGTVALSTAQLSVTRTTADVNNRHGLAVSLNTNATTSGTYNHRGLSFVVTPSSHTGVYNGAGVSAVRGQVLSYGGHQGTIYSQTGFSTLYGHHTGVGGTTNVTYGLQIQPYYKSGIIHNMTNIKLEAGKTGGTLNNKWDLWTDTGWDWVFDGDNQKLRLGETQGDFDLYSDGTNGILDVFNGIAGTAIKDEDDMSSDSAVHLASQQSIKAYVDTKSRNRSISFSPGDIKCSGVSSSVSGNYLTEAFDDANTDQCWFNFNIPQDYISGQLEFKIYWVTGATSGDSYWNISGSYGGEGEDKETGGFMSGTSLIDTAQDISDEVGIVSWTTSGESFAIDDVVGVQLRRHGGDSADTMTGDAKLLNIEVIYSGY